MFFCVCFLYCFFFNLVLLQESSEEPRFEVAKKKAPQKLDRNAIKPLMKLRFLGRSGVVTEVKGEKLQILFADNGRKEWVKLDAVLERGTQ